MVSAEKKIYTVSELTEKIKALLEEKYPFIWICGEISNFRVPASGHYYFTLKDDASQISAVMFRGQNKNLKFLPEDGMSVVGFGRISVYSPRGAYQVILEYLEPSGAGALQAAFEQLKAKLSEEGLFDETHKKPLPLLPRKICLITSAAGSVVHDMIRVMHRRFPDMHIEIIPVSMQGESAAPEIVSALSLLNSRKDADLAILARGGGSLEDLWPFNSEEVARAVFASAIPVVSAVGHETDYTISDFAADLRAPTPSAAAEIAVPVKRELEAAGRQLEERLVSRMKGVINEKSRYIRQLSDRLVHPRRRIDDLKLRIDDYSERILNSMLRLSERQKERLSWRTQRLYASSPAVLVQAGRTGAGNLAARLNAAANAHLRDRYLALREVNGRLQALNPAAVLERGYSITRRFSDQSIIRDASEAKINELLEIMLAKGRIYCRVEERGEDGQEDV